MKFVLLIIPKFLAFARSFLLNMAEHEHFSAKKAEKISCSAELSIITKTCLYNFDPLKPHFYIVKLGFTRVYIIFLISAQNIDCEYSLEPPHLGGSNEYSQSMF